MIRPALVFLIMLCPLMLCLSAAPAVAGAYDRAAAYNAEKNGVSLVILKDGVLVHESYPNQGRADKSWELASATKSFSGVIAAAAVQDGLLTLDEKVADTLPEWRGDARADITLRQLLTLTSGIDAGIAVKDRGMSYADAITRPALAKPGETFAYGPAAFQVFGEVMRRKLQAAYPGRYRDPVDYLQARVLTPLGIAPVSWRRDGGYARLPNGARFTARDLATFGEFVRRDGLHDGIALVDPATLSAIREGTEANPGYGLTWWLNRPIPPALANGDGPQANATDLYTNPLAADLPDDLIMAAGAGKQRLYILPAEGLVIVRQEPLTLRSLRSGGSGFSDVEFLRLVLAK